MLNVEPIIGRLLDALAWADEVVIVDMFSTDGTEAICRSYPNVAFYQNRDYIFANFNFGQERAHGDWVLKLDSDEVPTPEMAKEIVDTVLTPGVAVQFTGFLVPNRVYFYGKWLRFGVAWDPVRCPEGGLSYSPKLFRRGTARHECRSEHEQLTTSGKYGVLTHPYDHFSHPTVSGWIAKMNYYTDRDVERMEMTEPGFRAPRPARTIIAVAKVFLEHYVGRRGYRDGIHGFITCALNAAYLLVLRCKIWERHWRLTHADEVVEY